MTVLDVDAVRAFVTIADLKSFTRAAKALGTTQGAISVKLKRLENRVGKTLIERTPRQVRLSAHGAAFIDSARSFLAAHDRAISALASPRRRFVLGIATHVGGPEVPTLLTQLSAYDPNLTIEVRLEDSRDLLEAFDRGEIGAAIIRKETIGEAAKCSDRNISAGSLLRSLNTGPANRCGWPLPPPRAASGISRSRLWMRQE